MPSRAEIPMTDDPAGKALFVAVAISMVFAGWIVNQLIVEDPTLATGQALVMPMPPAATRPSDPSKVLAEPETISQSVPFDKCLQVIRSTASQLGVAPINVVDTDILTMVRFCADDASVIVSCSRPDQMAVTRSPHRPGCD